MDIAHNIASGKESRSSPKTNVEAMTAKEGSYYGNMQVSRAQWIRRTTM
jgi:hypothetical protein